MVLGVSDSEQVRIRFLQLVLMVCNVYRFQACVENLQTRVVGLTAQLHQVCPCLLLRPCIHCFRAVLLNRFTVAIARVTSVPNGIRQ